MRKGYTMGKKEKASAAVVGFDVGKSSHRACAVAPDGAALFNREVANRPGEIDRALADAGPGARVVVDQKRNIGALVVARARAAGNPVFYLPGIAMKKARDMFPATAKTDEIDAEVIARTAMGMPWTLREVAEEAPPTTALRMLASQRDFAVRSRTKAANRLRAVLLEADPAFEAAVDPSSRWQLAVLAELGGAFGIRAAGLRRFRSVAERSCGARREDADRLWAAAVASASSGRPELAAESELVRSLAARILSDGGEAARRAHLRLAGRRRDVRGAAHGAGRGAQDRGGARDARGRVAVPEPRRARRLHGARALQQAVGHVPQLDLSVPGRQQGPQEPARLLWIGNTYLDGFDRISPAFLNSTGLM